MQRFYWIEPGWLAGGSRPGEYGPADLIEDLAELEDYGIRAIVSLTETALDETIVREMGMTSVHIPIVDMTAPTGQQLIRALDAIDSAHAEQRPVLVHCLAGQGRTGTVLAAWLIRRGRTANEAIARVRSVCPGAVENDVQIACLRVFETSPVSSVQCPEFPPVS